MVIDKDLQVTLKIDKLGRVLIPKKVREASGLIPGATIILAAKQGDDKVRITLSEHKDCYLELTDWGWPLVRVPEPPDVHTYDLSEVIREERDRVLTP